MLFFYSRADKLEGGNATTTTPEPKHPTETPEAVVWPFIMAFIALLVGAIGFGSLFWWFYRKEIVQFLRESRDRLYRKGSGGSDHNNIYSTRTTPGMPVPPPRTKKFHPTTPDIFGQRKQITPDVISQPMQVTINGLPV